jgi:hypothetical protein
MRCVQFAGKACRMINYITQDVAVVTMRATVDFVIQTHLFSPMVEMARIETRYLYKIRTGVRSESK